MEVSVLVLLTLSLDWVWEVSFTLWSLYPRQNTSHICFIGGCIGSRVDIEVSEVETFYFLAWNQLKIPRLSNLCPNHNTEWIITLRVTLSNGQRISRILWRFPTKFTSCSAVAATVSHRPLTEETQILFQTVPCECVCVCACVCVRVLCACVCVCVLVCVCV